MSTAIHRQALRGLFVIAALLSSGCVAVSITPPLSANGLSPQGIYHNVAFTSGTFKRPHQIMGVVQMTQEGFRNYLAGELNVEGTDSGQIMQAIAHYVARHGADGIQNFSLIAENPRSSEERGAQQVGQTLKIIAALADNNPEGAGAAGDGETTRFFVHGELVKWAETAPPSPAPAPTQTPDVEDLTE